MRILNLSGPLFYAGDISAAATTQVVLAGSFEISQRIDMDNFYKSKLLYVWECYEPRTTNTEKSGLIECSKVSHYVNNYGVKAALHWKIVDYRELFSKLSF